MILKYLGMGVTSHLAYTRGLQLSSRRGFTEFSFLFHNPTSFPFPLQCKIIEIRGHRRIETMGRMVDDGKGGLWVTGKFKTVKEETIVAPTEEDAVVVVNAGGAGSNAGTNVVTSEPINEDDDESNDVVAVADVVSSSSSSTTATTTTSSSSSNK